ncbi:MAG: hypothetical protein WC004_03300 [Candidatus Absconditabacterales bacterium]
MSDKKLGLPDEGTLAQNVAFYAEGNYHGRNVEQYDALIEMLEKKRRYYAEEIGDTLQESEYLDLMHKIRESRQKTLAFVMSKKPFVIPSHLIPEGFRIDCYYESDDSCSHSEFNFARANESLGRSCFTRIEYKDGSRISFGIYDRHYYGIGGDVDFENLRNVKYVDMHDNEIVSLGQGIHAKMLSIVEKIAKANECDLIGEHVHEEDKTAPFMRRQGFKFNNHYAYKIITPRGKEYLQEVNTYHNNDGGFEVE